MTVLVLSLSTAVLLLAFRVLSLSRQRTPSPVHVESKAVPSASLSTESVDSSAIETLMSTMQDAVLAIDANEKVLFYNSKFAILFELSQINPSKPLLYEIIRQSDILEAYRQSISSNQSTSIIAEFSSPRSLERRFFNLSIAPMGINREGQSYGVIGIFHDITELKRAEQIRIDFVGNVSHELRTPLTSIKGYADTLRDDFSKGQLEQIGRYVEIIQRNSDRLLGLVNDLLDLSSLESGQDLQKTLLSTREVSAKILGQLGPQLTSKNQDITLKVETEHVLADPARLDQVLVNLVENAIRYTPQKSRIEIAWALTGQGDVELQISDTGSGIAKEHLPRLFERFYRIDKARSREQGGTGLGLAIVKHIMQRHGGSVSVSSELGKGSSFRCIFPSNH